MKKEMKKVCSTALFAALAGSVLFGAQPALAQDVVIVGPPCIFNVLSSAEEDAEVTEKEVETFRIYGQVGDDLMLIATPDAEEGEEEYISKDELAGLLPDLELDKFPKKEEVQTFSQGANSEDVKFLQETLADLKFLDGEIDGAYGGGTAEAIILKTAGDMLRQGCRESRLVRIALKKGAMYCGGEITVLLRKINAGFPAVRNLQTED